MTPLIQGALIGLKIFAAIVIATILIAVGGAMYQRKHRSHYHDPL